MERHELTDELRNWINPGFAVSRDGSPDFCAAKTKKADVTEHPRVFDHVGLLINELPGMAGLPFI
jgi:hypothetical protein